MDFQKMQLDHLRQYDKEIANFRTYYFSMEPEERGRFLAHLEKLDAVRQETDWDYNLKINIQYDELDENGETKDWLDCEFSVFTLIHAIKDWEKGEPHAPDCCIP